jgi:protein-S-isoprenylcysteine O-methyltransferase Ste14
MLSLDWLPLWLLAVFFGVALGFRSVLHLWRHGSTGVVVHRGRPGWGEAGAVLLPLGLLIEAARAALWPQPRAPWLLVAGLGAWLPGLALVVAAQWQMGRSWRVGIDPQARPGLVTHGLYARTRNPIYAGMLLALIGFALVLPTLPAIALVAAAALCVHIQVRAEEGYLARTYGDEFAHYAARVGRFAPRC